MAGVSIVAPFFRFLVMPGRRFVALLALGHALCLAAQQPFDLLIAGGRVVDGSGSPAQLADIGIRDGKIAAIGNLGDAAAIRTIDADGLVVAPGFIDIHNHSDDTLLEEPRCESMIRQGVTTVILGEGRSMGPLQAGERPWTTLGGYFDFVERKGAAVNVASYVGHEQVWTYVKGHAMTAPTSAEIESMKKQVARAMEDGALGLSTYLMMPASHLVETAQLVELAKVAGSYGGIYSSHIRDEGTGVFDAVAEAIEVGKQAGVRVDIIHLKIAERQLWGNMSKIVEAITAARAGGHDVRANVYPYTAGQNNLRSIIPPWAHDGGTEKMLERLRDPRQRAKMRRDILNGLDGWYNHYLATGGGWEGMLLVLLSSERNRPFIGHRMSELIESRGADPVGVLFDVLLEEGGSVPTVFFHHSEPDMQMAMKQPFTSIGSDGSAISPYGPRKEMNPHPRWYGTFPRMLGRYVRELSVVTLPEAIHKMTGMNAEKVNIRNRGLLKIGYCADVSIFDPRTVIDRATFEAPQQYPVGIPYVIVNGEVVLDSERHTGALPGKVIRGPGYRVNHP